MTLQELFDVLPALELSSITSFILIIIVIITSIVEISPIKINPWSWIAKKMGSILNHEVIEQLKEMKKEVDEIKKSCQEDKKERLNERATDARRRILNFDDELRRGVLHSQEQFNQIIEDADFYSSYCNAHSTDYPNHKGVNAIANINAKYQLAKEKNNFI